MPWSGKWNQRDDAEAVEGDLTGRVGTARTGCWRVSDASAANGLSLGTAPVRTCRWTVCRPGCIRVHGCTHRARRDSWDKPGKLTSTVDVQLGIVPGSGR